MKLKQIIAFAIVLGCMTGESYGLTVNVLDHSNFTTAQSQKLAQAVSILNQVLNSPEFKSRVLNFSYQGQLGFVQNNGMSNQQIYDYLMAGAEEYPTPQPANQMADMHLTIYFPPWYKRYTSAVAFTDVGDPLLHIYNSYYNSASLADLSETLIHEWTHKMGFDHDFNATPQRPYSVPYGIGGIINDLVSKQLQLLQ